MSTWHSDRSLTLDTGRFIRTCGFAMLISILHAGLANAQSIETEWRTETRFYLSGMSYYWAKEDASAFYDTLAATGELRFRSDARPWYASLFADVRYSTDQDYSDNLNIGGYVKYGHSRWDATASAFVSMSPQTDDTWFYSGRLRYRLAEDHKIGIEAFGTLKDVKSPQLMLGYYGNLSDKLSITLAAGRGTGNGPDLSARLELVWRVF